MDAGQEISDHKAPYVATVHVLDGAMQFTVEEQEREMSAGSWLVMPPGAPHALRATRPCRFLLTLVKG
jgi:quercetin dioxygenase-like cupin family protein